MSFAQSGVCRTADILVAAIGRCEFVTADMVTDQVPW
jgi:5,10-methylene-tetrahydrofolate dehydrogenase/methenyl tetrahydrofolate cyclohydrolase